MVQNIKKRQASKAHHERSDQHRRLVQPAVAHAEPHKPAGNRRLPEPFLKSKVSRQASGANACCHLQRCISMPMLQARADQGPNLEALALRKMRHRKHERNF